MKRGKLKKIFICSILTIVGGFILSEDVYARTTLNFTCINKDNISETTSYSDLVGGEIKGDFLLPDYCFTGTGCTLDFNKSDLSSIGKIDFGSGQEYFFINQGTGLSLYAEGGPSPATPEIYAAKYNLVEISPDFNKRGKAVLWMGKNDDESRWLTFYSKDYLGFGIFSSNNTMPFPEMFLTQGMAFTTDDSIELQLFYGMKKLELEIEEGKIVSDMKIKSGDSDVTLEKIGDEGHIGSNLTVNTNYAFNFTNLYKPKNEIVLELTYIKDYHTFDSALAVSNQTEVETTTVTKTLTFTRSAFNNDFLEFMDDFEVQYLARAEFNYCDTINAGDTTCTKGNFNPYLQLVYYKDGKVIGTQQVRVHDFDILDPFDPDNSQNMDDLTTLNVDRNYIIPITVKVKDNANEAVRNADKIAYYLTDGKIEASSETMPRLSFGIGAGLQIEKRVD